MNWTLAQLACAAIVFSCSHAFADNIQMLPPTDFATPAAPCSAQTGGLLQWDGLTSVKCVKGATGDQNGNIAMDGTIRPGSTAVQIGGHCDTEGAIGYDVKSTSHQLGYCNEENVWVGIAATRDPIGGHVAFGLSANYVDADIAPQLGATSQSVNVVERTTLVLTCAASGTHNGAGGTAQVISAGTIDGATCSENSSGATNAFAYTFWASASCTRVLDKGDHSIGCVVSGERINVPGTAWMDYSLTR